MQLCLTLKKKFFDEILSGVKTKEYREIKPYWIRRLCNVGSPICDARTLKLLGVSRENLENCMIHECQKGEYSFRDISSIVFKNGYKSDAPEFEIECLGVEVQNNISTPIGSGSFFVFHLGKILNKRVLKS